MKHLTNIETIRTLWKDLKEVRDDNFNTAIELDLRKDHDGANLLRIMNESMDLELEALKAIIDNFGYIEDNKKDREYYSTRRLVQSDKISTLDFYRHQAEQRLEQLIETWNAEHPEKQVILG